MSNRRDGPDEGGDRAPTQRELCEREIARWKRIEIDAREAAADARAEIDYLNQVLIAIALRPAATVTRLEERRAPADVPAPAAATAPRSEQGGGTAAPIEKVAVEDFVYASATVTGRGHVSAVGTVVSPEGGNPMNRTPTLAETVNSGAFAAGPGWTFEHRHHPLRVGGFDAAVHVIRYDAAGVEVTPVYPAGAPIFKTAEDARAYNVRLAKWFFTQVNAPSPPAPTTFTDPSSGST